MQKHIGRKHLEKVLKNEDVKSVQNVTSNVQNVTPKVQNVTPNVQNVTPNIFQCSKCNKIYKTARHLHNHESKCNKVDSLTCPKCMISFSNRHHKSRHIKANNCKARSIIHARTPNIQNITNNNTTNNNIDNSVNKTINNNFIINSFGSERIDHISDDEIIKILTSGINTIPLYIEKKHFDKNFPENNNIKYTLENKCKVYKNNLWKEDDLSDLSSSLIEDNTGVLLLYCEDNDIRIANCIKNTEIIVMVGYPGSGKSTVSNSFDKSKYKVVSGDEFLTSKKMIIEAKKHIEKGFSVIFDATNPTIEKRKEYINLANLYSLPIRCIVLKTDITESMFRNNKRQKVIPKITYYVFRKKYQEPTTDEGFSEIISI